MPQPTTPATPAAIPGAAAIRLGIILLAAAGFALSYDALRHMAVASHVREPLTYAFPLVIDGFIAIGIGALLILRTAPLRARLYVWALVGTATATSITANALHAIRLNQQSHPTADGLRLDDLTVGALSAIAPLALAGAVHLYLHVHRHPGAKQSATRSQEGSAHHSKSGETDRSSAGDPKPSPGSGDGVAESAVRRGRRPEVDDEVLLAIARTAPLGRDGRVSRRAVEQAVRAAGHSVAKDRAADITQRLQAEHDHARAELASAR